MVRFVKSEIYQRKISFLLLLHETKGVTYFEEYAVPGLEQPIGRLAQRFLRHIFLQYCRFVILQLCHNLPRAIISPGLPCVCKTRHLRSFAIYGFSFGRRAICYN